MPALDSRRPFSVREESAISDKIAPWPTDPAQNRQTGIKMIPGR